MIVHRDPFKLLEMKSFYTPLSLSVDAIIQIRPNQTELEKAKVLFCFFFCFVFFPNRYHGRKGPGLKEASAPGRKTGKTTGEGKGRLERPPERGKEDWKDQSSFPVWGGGCNLNTLWAWS